MTRVYSKRGCTRCKLRKKKCDEIRPVCSACAKWAQWRDSCSYAAPLPIPSSSSTAAVNLFKDTSQSLSVQRLGAMRHSGNEMESKVLQVTPELLKELFSPMSANSIRDLQTMWQLMLSNELLRNTCVACFSRFLDNSTALVRLSQEAYGRSLQALPSKILKVNLDQETAISVIISMVFLGKLESFAPRSNADMLEHWGPLIPLLTSAQIDKLSKNRVLPANERAVILEALLYHVGTHAIFSRTTEKVWNLWKVHNIYQRICTYDPDGPNRIRRSPALSGQYMLYEMAFYVAYLLQRCPKSRCPPVDIDELEAKIRQYDSRLDNDFAALSATTNPAKYKAECAVYHFWCNSLLICVTALRKSSQGQRVQMKTFANTGMKMFLDLPVYGNVHYLSEHASHFVLTAIWPIQIQGCAACNIEQFEKFMDHFVLLERFLDPGHQIRAQCLFDQVRANLEKVSTEGEIDASAQALDQPTPAGLELLRSAVTISEPTKKTTRV